MIHSYRTFLTIPGVSGLMMSSFIVRLPQAMIGIGIITMLIQQRDLYWLAGIIGATFTLANALFGPLASKFVDRHGQRKVLPFMTAFSVIMLLALLMAAYMEAPAWLLVVLAALAGTMPNMPAMTRARWTELFRGKPQLHMAFSLDTVLTELSYIVGPPLTIGLSTGCFAEAGPLTAILLLVFGMGAFLFQRQTEPKTVIPETGTGRSKSSLLTPGLCVIVLSFLAMGVIGGSIDVAVVAFANDQHWPTAASFILAAYALGSMIAGLLFGVFKTTLPIEKQFLIGILVTATTITLPIFSPDVYVMTIAIFVAGLSFAPTVVVVMNLGTIIIPPSRLTEGLTWMTTGISIGVALGGALSGRIIDSYGVKAGFGVPIAAGMIMVIMVLIGLPALRTRSRQYVDCQGTSPTG